MIVLKGLKETFAEIGSSLCFLDEKISPLNNPENFDKIKDFMGKEIYLPTLDYRVKIYSWFVNRVRNTDEKTREFRIGECINEIFTNAFLHGNLSSLEKQIQVRLDVGMKGSLLSIVDEGNGFDYREVLDKFRRGKKYFNYQGNGFKAYEKSKYNVSFDNGGKTTFLWYSV